MVNAPSILPNREETAGFSSAATYPRERRFRRFGEAMNGVAEPAPVSIGLKPPPPASEPAPVVEEAAVGDAFAAKPFIGPNATYYDDRWRWMSWRGRSHGWNWAAAGTFGVWLAYRKMYRWAALYLTAFTLLLLLAVSGVAVTLAGFLFALGTLALGIFGNILYFHHFRRVAWAVEEQYPDHRSRLSAMIAAGGVDARGARLMVVNLFGALGLALLVSLVGGGLALIG